jgi:hypothetical protein
MILVDTNLLTRMTRSRDPQSGLARAASAEVCGPVTMCANVVTPPAALDPAICPGCGKRVHCYPSTDVFVGTDGRGGRLLAFDPRSGKETLNIKPPLGGAGTLSKVPSHQVLVAKFWTSPRDSVSGNLFVLSMRDRSHLLGGQCRELLGTWQHGAVCVAGQNGERLANVDIR